MRSWIVMAALAASTPAFADEAIKAMAEKIAHAYCDAYNKHDVEALAALYAPDGMLLTPDGQAHSLTDLRALWAKEFAKATPLSECFVTKAYRYGNAAAAYGTVVSTLPGKDAKMTLNWNAAYVVEGDGLKEKLLSVSVPPRAN